MFVLSLFVQAQDPDFAGWPAEQQRRWEEINAGGNDFELQQRLNQAEQNRIQRERNLSEALAEIAGKMQQQGNGGGQSAGGAAWPGGEDQARLIDRAFQRDSRRYDRGFSLY